MHPKMPVIYCFFKRVELIKFEDLGVGGGPLSLHSSVYRCTTMKLQSIQIFVIYIISFYIYVHIIYLVVICFKQIFLYHGGYYNLNV